MAFSKFKMLEKAKTWFEKSKQGRLAALFSTKGIDGKYNTKNCTIKIIENDIGGYTAIIKTTDGEEYRLHLAWKEKKYGKRQKIYRT